MFISLVFSQLSAQHLFFTCNQTSAADITDLMYHTIQNDPSETLNPSAWTGPEPIIICATSLAHASLMLHLVPVLESNGSYTSSPLLYSTPTLSNPMSYRKALVVTAQPLIADQVASLREKHVNVDCMSFLRTVDDSWDIMRHLRSQQKPDICYITPEKLRESNAMQDILA
jgi:hypothetical protein